MLLSNHEILKSLLPQKYPAIWYSWVHATITPVHAEFIRYDDGCHLHKYANKCRATLTDTTRKLAQMKIVIDKMHMAGHIDSWHKEHCDPRKFKELENVC